MKQLLISGWVSLSVVLTAWAADPIFFNDSPVVSPPDDSPAIDATAWVNRSIFSITDLNLLPLPFESQNTLFFTNTSGGVMSGNPGFRFFHNVGPQRLWMDTWTNNGTITTDASVGIFGTFGTIFVANSQASVLMVRSTNIASTGPLRSGMQGLIHLEGKNVNLKRNGLRTGSSPQPNLFIGGTFLLSSNYVNDFGITDFWWGAGTNNYLSNRGMPMRIDNFGGFPNFSIPFPESPQHQVIENFGTFSFTNFVILPQFNFGNYAAAVWTNQVTPSNFVVQVVFYPTNNVDTNFSTEVRFLPDGSGASVAVVAFNSVDFDIVDQAYTTNGVFLSDALATVTNVFLARSIGGNTRRPDTYELSRTAPFGFYDSGFGFRFSDPPNAIFSTDLIWNPRYRDNIVTNLYAGYDALVSSVTSSFGTTGGDPTNFPGRIQIIGEEVNLELTRIRAESALTIKASRNLTSNRVAKVDAPFVNLDVTSRAPQLNISNIAPATVHRLSGEIAAWSGTWKNYDTSTSPTNEILFHVLIVDPFIQTLQPVVVNEFAAHVANLVIDDVLNIGKSFVADAVGFTVKGGVFMPAGASWGGTNLLRVLNFTNQGTLNILQLFNAGVDRETPYYNYVNRGTNTAATHFIRTTNFDNSGSMIASGGLMQIDTLKASMMGVPLTFFTNIFTNPPVLIFTNGTFTNITVVTTNVFTNTIGALLQGNSDVQIFARDLVVSNSFLQAGIVNQGTLIFSVTNRLTDSGTIGTNHWSGSAGFQMLTHPAISDLLGTYLSSTAVGFNQESFHTWCAEDRGATTNGYNNNLALGKLTLDGSPNSLFHFSPPPGQINKAMYVDYLELLNYATNYNTGALDISPDITIYFANANLNPVKLDGSNGGRLRWVRNFTGPLSSTNITYPSGQTYAFNVALVRSKDFDSDSDGIVNADDPYPIYEGPGNGDGTAGLLVTRTNIPSPRVQFSWFALARSTNRVEFVASISATNWTSLTNIINGPTNGTLRAQDAMPANGKRFYRIRVDMP